MWCWCVLCLGLFELLESKPSVAVKVLLDGLGRAKRGYAETVAARRMRKLSTDCFPFVSLRGLLLLTVQCVVVQQTKSQRDQFWSRDRSKDLFLKVSSRN